MAPNSSFGSQSMRMNATHIFFWGGVLSNWDQTCTFPGSRAMEILLIRLDGLEMAHPSADQTSTQLIFKHKFNCGEQFMMACKAWLFDTDSKTPTLKAILASKKPKEQKALGRKVPDFNEQIWRPASIEVVVASQLARAEINQHLTELYQSSGDKVFVEGSPRDTIWGVGMYWNDEAIEDEKNWRGENRLGNCHGLTRAVLWKQNGEEHAVKSITRHKDTTYINEHGETVITADIDSGEADGKQLKTTSELAATARLPSAEHGLDT